MQKEIEKYLQIDTIFCTQMNHLLYPRLYIVHFYDKVKSIWFNRSICKFVIDSHFRPGK